MAMHFDPNLNRFGGSKAHKNTINYKNIPERYIGLFKSHIEQNNALPKNVSIYINNNIVTDVSILARELDKSVPNNDLRILGHIEKALKLSISAGIENSEKPFKTELEIIKLIPKIDDQADVIAFYMENNDRKAFEILRKMEAIKRSYDPPIWDFSKHLSPSESQIQECIKVWFGDNIGKALNSNIYLFFGAKRLMYFHDLSSKLKENGLENDGKTFRLMNRCLKAVLIKRGEIEPARNIYFDLLKLLPAKLIKEQVKNKDVEDIIDAIDNNVVIHFLRKIRALEW